MCGRGRAGERREKGQVSGLVAEEALPTPDSAWRNSGAESDGSEDSHSSGTILRLLLDGSAAADTEDEESREKAQMLKAWREEGTEWAGPAGWR